MDVLWLAEAMLVVGELHVHSNPVHSEDRATPVTVIICNLQVLHVSDEDQEKNVR
jgi:hypothetical protein